MLGANATQRPAEALCCDFEQKRGKGAAPFLYVGIVHFYASFFEGWNFFWQKQHNEHMKVSMHLCYYRLPTQTLWPKLWSILSVYGYSWRLMCAPLATIIIHHNWFRPQNGKFSSFFFILFWAGQRICTQSRGIFWWKWSLQISNLYDQKGNSY